MPFHFHATTTLLVQFLSNFAVRIDSGPNILFDLRLPQVDFREYFLLIFPHMMYFFSYMFSPRKDDLRQPQVGQNATCDGV